MERTLARLTRAELTEEVHQVIGLPLKESDIVVCTILDSIVRALRSGNKVEIRGFGTFNTRQRPRAHRHRPGRPPAGVVQAAVTVCRITSKASAASHPACAPRSRAAAMTASAERVCGHGRISEAYSSRARDFTPRACPVSGWNHAGRNGLPVPHSVAERTSQARTVRTGQPGCGRVAAAVHSAVMR